MENFIFLLLSFVVVIANDNLVFLREHVIVYIPQIYVTRYTMYSTAKLDVRIY